MSTRLERINDEIQREIGNLLIKESRDPRLKMLSITGVSISNDLSHAKIFYSMLDPNPKHLESVKNALSKASAFFRTRLANLIDLRITPKLSFIYDESLEKANHLSTLIDHSLKKIEKS
jgi:ribosome-binding factor A